jgi:hypothetical protein
MVGLHLANSRTNELAKSHFLRCGFGKKSFWVWPDAAEIKNDVAERVWPSYCLYFLWGALPLTIWFCLG